MDVGGTVMGKEVGGRIKRSVRHPADRESQSSLFIFFAKRKKKNQGPRLQLSIREHISVSSLCNTTL